MKLLIQFLDDEDKVILEHRGSAENPSAWKSSDKIIAGQYEIYGFSYQPHVRCLYPNGQPPPQLAPVSPFTGQMNVPNRPFPDMPGFRSRLSDPISAPPGRNDFLKSRYQGDEGPKSL